MFSHPKTINTTARPKREVKNKINILKTIKNNKNTIKVKHYTLTCTQGNIDRYTCTPVNVSLLFKEVNRGNATDSVSYIFRQANEGVSSQNTPKTITTPTKNTPHTIISIEELNKK
jgi:hypothetical protein